MASHGNDHFTFFIYLRGFIPFCLWSLMAWFVCRCGVVGGGDGQWT